MQKKIGNIEEVTIKKFTTDLQLLKKRKIKKKDGGKLSSKIMLNSIKIKSH